jgi:peptide/nickel transport system substrate-binding protein
VLIGGAFVLVAALTSGCVSTQQPADRARADQVVIALASAVTTLDPMNTNTTRTDLSVLSSIYSSLVERGPDLRLRPSVASTWEQVAPDRWRFHLNSAARFSDGTPLDASVVAWNVARLQDTSKGLRQTSNFSQLAGAEVVDPLTVDLSTKGPWPALPDALSSLYLLSPDWVASHNPVTAAMGSGPYELVSYAPGASVELRARPDYWGDAVSIREVTFQTVPSSTSRVSGLLSGELDVISDFEPSDIDRLRTDRSLEVNQIDTTRMAMMNLNSITGPMTDVRVRRAVNYAVDKKAITDNLLKGSVSPSPGQLVTPLYSGYDDKIVGYPYDPDLARSLLSEAGYGPTNPLRVDLSVPTGTYVAGELVVQAVAQQLEQVGIEVNTRSLTYSVFMQNYLKERAMPDLQYMTLAWPTLAADGVFRLFTAGNSYSYWNDPQFTDAVNLASSSNDDSVRQEALAEAAQRARDEAPVLFLFAQPGFYAQTAALEWKARPDDWLRPADMSWSRSVEEGAK